MEVYNYNGDEFTVILNKVPLFRANEIATALHYKKPRNAVLNHVNKEDIFTWEDIKTDTLQKHSNYKNLKSDTKFITDTGVRALMFGSKKTDTTKFKQWVTLRLLPSLKKTENDGMTPERRLELLDKGVTFMQRFGPLDDRDVTFFKSEARNLLMGESQPTNKRREVPISDRIVQLGYKYRAKDKKTCMAIGVAMKNAYFEKHGCAPPKREQWVEGATRMVCCYTESDFPLLDPIIKKHYKNL